MDNDALNATSPNRSGAWAAFRQWMAIAVILSGGSCMALVVGALSPVGHDIELHFGAGGNGRLAAQAIFVFPSLGIMLGAPVAGWLIARFGARNFLLAILVVFGLSGSAGLYLDNLWALLATRLLVGFAVAGVMTATIVLIDEHSDHTSRSRFLGYQSAIGAGAGVVVLLGAGQVADLGGWRTPFALYLLSFIFFILAAIFIPARPPRKAERERSVPQSSILGLWPIYMLIAILFLAAYMPNNQLPFLMADDGVTKHSTFALAIGIGSASVAFGGYLVAGRVVPRLGQRWTLSLVFAFMGVGLVVMGLRRTPRALASLGAAILGDGNRAGEPVTVRHPAGLAPRPTRAAAPSASATYRPLCRRFHQPWNRTAVVPDGHPQRLHRTGRCLRRRCVDRDDAAATPARASITNRPAAKEQR